MLQIRISKYDPNLRDGNGVYINTDEWTSICDVGTKITAEEYFQIESNYVEAILNTLAEACTPLLVITAWEDNRKYLPKEHYLGYEMEFNDIEFHVGMQLNFEYIAILIKMALRELVWFKLENDRGEFIHSGYEMYFYVGVEKNISKKIPYLVGGLFIEEFPSPYSNA